MAAKHFGLATPVSFNKLEKGALVLAAPHTGQRFFGVVSKVNHDHVLVVLSASDNDIHAAIDLGNVVDDLWLIPGTLEIEPTSDPFMNHSKRTTVPSYIINSDGNIGSQFLYRNEVGQHQMFAVDLNTGEHLDRADKVAAFQGAKLYIRQEGRKERFEWPSLTPDQ